MAKIVAEQCPFHSAVEDKLGRIESSVEESRDDIKEVKNIVTRIEHIDGPIGKLNEKMAVQERVTDALHARVDDVEEDNKTAKKTGITGAVTGGIGGLIVILLLVMKILGYI